MALYRQGSRGATVKRIQKKVGCSADGIFGPDTKRHVIAWQKKHKLEADGVVGPKTWAKMFPAVAPAAVINSMPVPVKPQTKGLVFLLYVLAAWFDNPDRAKDYIWSAAGTNFDHKNGDPEWDCSGLFYAALKFAGYAIGRMTANDYRQMMHPISAPSQIGDAAFHLDSNGHATHIVIFTDDGYFIEARGAAYGIERHAVSTAAGRGLKWYRSDKINAALKVAA